MNKDYPKVHLNKYFCMLCVYDATAAVVMVAMAADNYVARRTSTLSCYILMVVAGGCRGSDTQKRRGV